MKAQFAQRLRAAREAMNPEMTQRAVAKLMDKSFSAVNLWEAGKTQPNAEDIAALSKLYGISCDWLLGVDSSATSKAIHTSKSAPRINTVPVVQQASLIRWTWEEVEEVLQTSVAYHPQTAAAIKVESDALQSTCPIGSYAVVSKAHDIKSGSTVLASIGNAREPVLRRYLREGDMEMLLADDTRFPSYSIQDGAKILGRVTEVVIRKRL